MSINLNVYRIKGLAIFGARRFCHSDILTKANHIKPYRIHYQKSEDSEDKVNLYRHAGTAWSFTSPPPELGTRKQAVHSGVNL